MCRRRVVNFGSFLEKLKACQSDDDNDDDHGSGEDHERDEKALTKSPKPESSDSADDYDFKEWYFDFPERFQLSLFNAHLCFTF